MKENHPIESLMLTSMSSIRDMVDVNTIIGEPIESIDGMTIIPISKVSFGFVAGGSEFTTEAMEGYSKKDEEELVQYRLPFGGGAGAGASINPVAFLVIQNGNARLLPMEHSSAIDKLIDYVPDLIEKVNQMFNKKMQSQNEKTDKIVEQIKIAGVSKGDTKFPSVVLFMTLFVPTPATLNDLQMATDNNPPIGNKKINQLFWLRIIVTKAIDFVNNVPITPQRMPEKRQTNISFMCLST